MGTPQVTVKVGPVAMPGHADGCTGGSHEMIGLGSMMAIPQVTVEVGPVAVPGHGAVVQGAQVAAVVALVHVVQVALLVKEHHIAEGAAEVGLPDVRAQGLSAHRLQL